jgi:putative ABC transport system permease protein
MRFFVRMVLREIRASWRRLLFFFLCIAIGVASIVTVRSVVQSVGVTLTGEARALLAADLMVRSNAPHSDTVRAVLAREQQAGRITAQSDAVEIDTMVRPADGRPGSRVVELRAVEASFPFYGTLTLHDGVYSHQLLRNRGILVRPELMAQLNLRVGDRVQIGEATFEIRGVVDKEPGRSLGMFTLGPRVFVDLADLPATGLMTFGTRADYEVLVKVPEPLLERLTQDLDRAFVNELVSIRSYRSRQNRTAENLARTENYLSLVGLVILLLGGIGVSSVTRVFVQQKIRSIAILKCVGSTSAQVFTIYVAQVLLLGLAGSALGVALAAGTISVLPSAAGRIAGELGQVQIALTPAAVVQGTAVGLLVSILFALVPLLDVRHVKPSLLLRQDIQLPRRIDWPKWIASGVVAATLVAIASWQAGSLEIGLILSAGFVAVAFVLSLAGAALVRAVQPLRHSSSFVVRHAVLHVIRPGNQTRVILLAVGLGTFFILAVRSIEANLLEDLRVQLGDNSFDMLLMDVQQDQQQDLVSLVDAENGEAGPPALIPILRTRIVAVRGRDVNLESYEEVRGRGRLSREFTVTYRSHLEANEQLSEGTWWGDEPVTPGQAEVSIEEGLRERFSITIGDEMSFDVLGRTITARVTSVRTVDFRDFRGGSFVFVFRPGTFANAPHTYVASAMGPPDIATRSRLQDLIVTRFPNVSVIDLRTVLDTVQGVINNVTRAVTIVGGLVMVSGGLILVGAISMTKFRRIYEAAILKTLGASNRLIASMLLLEYGVLGAMAGIIGALGAMALSWSLARFVLDLTWAATPLIAIGGIAATSLLVAGVGALASVDLLRHKPLATLRAE